MDKKRFSIIKFVKKLHFALKEFPKFLSKFSQKTYTNGQIIVLKTLKEILNISYEDLVSFVDDFSEISEIIHLKRTPNPSTILRRSRKIGVQNIEKLLHKSSRKKKSCIAIDATGFENHHASKHYCKTINLKFSRRKYIKLSIAIDTQTQLICAQKTRIAPAHDTKDFIPLLKKIKGTKIKMVFADKGYDSKKNRKFVYKKLGARPNIPKRKNSGPNYLSKMYDKKTYHQRSKSETVFSVIKRLFGSALRSSKLMTQRIEILYKCLAYNFRRLSMNHNSLEFRGLQ